MRRAAPVRITRLSTPTCLWSPTRTVGTASGTRWNRSFALSMHRRLIRARGGELGVVWAGSRLEPQLGPSLEVRAELAPHRDTWRSWCVCASRS